jgi:hypothetical protein
VFDLHVFRKVEMTLFKRLGLRPRTLALITYLGLSVSLNLWFKFT